MNKSLFTLMIGGLGIGITEFVMMGILPDIAISLNISIPHAGYLISAYALGVVVGAPLFVIATSKYQPRKLLITLMIIFTIFNLMSAISTDYHLLIISRFLSGLPHGAFFGIGAVVASKISGKGKEAQAIAILFSGITLANLFGVPLGTFIGHNYSWRYTFVLISMIGIITIICLIYWLPNVINNERKKIKTEITFFYRLESWIIISIIAIGSGGLFSWLSYIAPLLVHVSEFNPDNIPAIMFLAGTGMVIGNFIGGKLADKYSPAKTTAIILLAMTISLLLIHFTSQYKIMALLMTFTTGAVAFALVSPIQMLMINSSQGSEMLASSVSQACFNIGHTLGAFLGGLPLTFGMKYNTPELSGALMTAISLVIIMTSINKLENSRN